MSFEMELNLDLRLYSTGIVIRDLCVHDTESQIRCESVDFYSALYRLDKSYQLFIDDQLNFIGLIVDLLKNDLDYEVQLKCSKFLNDLFGASGADPKHVELFFNSNFLTCIFDIINDEDDYNNQIKSNLIDFVLIFKQKYWDHYKSFCLSNDAICAGFAKLFDTSANEFEAKLMKFQLNDDCYSSNPFNILDDIVSVYEFNMNENKILDCY
jgi:hypothetical protein